MGHGADVRLIRRGGILSCVEVPAHLLACPGCRAIMPWSDDRGTVGDHTVKGPDWQTWDCPAIGEEGIDLGPEDHYEFGRGYYSMKFVGGKGVPRAGIRCPFCKGEGSVRMPEEDVIKACLVSVKCPRCDRDIPLDLMTVGPQGIWIKR